MATEIAYPSTFVPEMISKTDFNYSRDLNSQLVRYSYHRDLFSHQMVHYTMVTRYSDQHLVNGPVFRPSFEYR